MQTPAPLPPAFTFSQSSLQDYSDCPRRFQLRYIERLSYPAIESEPALENERRQQEGNLFHRLVQQHRIGLPPESLAPLAATPDLQRWWDNYLGYDFGLGDCAVHTELVLTAPLGDHRLLAKYDLVAVGTDGQCLLFDWKTYGKRPKDEWMAVRLQTRVYRYLLVQAGAELNQGRPIEPGQVQMIYWYANHPSEPARFPYTPALFQRDKESLERLVSTIQADKHFARTADERKCAYCPYRSYCERGIQAGVDEELETGLAGSDLNFEQVQEIEY